MTKFLGDCSSINVDDIFVDKNNEEHIVIGFSDHLDYDGVILKSLVSFNVTEWDPWSMYLNNFKRKMS